MNLVIDGHNLIGQIPSMQLSDQDDEEKLIAWLQAFLLASRSTAVVFFDKGQPGHAKGKKLGRLTVFFVRFGTADDAIANHLDRMKAAAKNVTVVSSDLQVQSNSRSQHASVLSSSDFYRHVSTYMADRSRPQQSDSVQSNEVDYWLEQFSNPAKPVKK